jgi:hypothetical protein
MSVFCVRMSDDVMDFFRGGDHWLLYRRNTIVIRFKLYVDIARVLHITVFGFIWDVNETLYTHLNCNPHWIAVCLCCLRNCFRLFPFMSLSQSVAFMKVLIQSSRIQHFTLIHTKVKPSPYILRCCLNGDCIGNLVYGWSQLYFIFGTVSALRAKLKII